MTFRASSLNRQAEGMRRFLADFLNPECVSPDAPEPDPHVVQAEAEMQVHAMKGAPADELLEREWAFGKATWTVYADPSVRHLDVLAWIGATLHERSQAVPTPFDNADALFHYLYAAKTIQLGEKPLPTTAALLHEGAMTVWNAGVGPFLTEWRAVA